MERGAFGRESRSRIDPWRETENLGAYRTGWRNAPGKEIRARFDFLVFEPADSTLRCIIESWIVGKTDSKIFIDGDVRFRPGFRADYMNLSQN